METNINISELTDVELNCLENQLSDEITSIQKDAISQLNNIKPELYKFDAYRGLTHMSFNNIHNSGVIFFVDYITKEIKIQFDITSTDDVVLNSDGKVNNPQFIDNYNTFLKDTENLKKIYAILKSFLIEIELKRSIVSSIINETYERRAKQMFSSEQHKTYEILKYDDGVAYVLYTSIDNNSYFLNPLRAELKKQSPEINHVIVDYVLRNGLDNRFFKITYRELSDKFTCVKVAKEDVDYKWFDDYIKNHKELLDNSTLLDKDKSYFLDD